MPSDRWLCGFHGGWRDGVAICLNTRDGGDGTCSNQLGSDMWNCPVEVRRRERIGRELEDVVAYLRQQENSKLCDLLRRECERIEARPDLPQGFQLQVAGRCDGKTARIAPGLTAEVLFHGDKKTPSIVLIQAADARRYLETVDSTGERSEG